MVDNLKIRHRAEIDAIMIEQCTYKKIIQQMVHKLKSLQRKNELQKLQLIGASKFEIQATKYVELYQKQEVTIAFQQSQIDKLKISLIEYDRHIREKELSNQEFLIHQLESENAHLRKLLHIPDELFTIDPEEEKKKEADRKKNMLRSIDDKLKKAEQKLQKKQTAADIYYQQ